jgi:hypothetical protein
LSVRLRRALAGLAEYSVILALAVIVVVLVLALMGGQVKAPFQDVIDILQGP